MKLPPEAIKEFQQLWFARFGAGIDEQTARVRAEKLLSMFVTVLAAPEPSPNNKGPP